MKKLPIGIQTFREIREKNYLYVDKTQRIAQVLDAYVW
ncbi:MAG: AAA family ATPase [Bacteroidia bacterium]|nr:AAA family ATPase [Bacteroidia bacterium]